MATLQSTLFSLKNSEPTNDICMILNTDGTTWMGIGTHAPTAPLDVRGAATYIAPAGSASGVVGSGFTYTTGDGGGGNASSGTYAITLGAQTGSAIPGVFKVVAPAASDRAIANNTPFIVNQYGVGISTTPQVGVKAVLGVGVTWTDPTAESKACSLSETIILTANNAQPNDSLNPSMYIQDGGFNLSSTNGQWCVLSEMHVQTPSSGTHTLLGGITGSAWLDAGSTGNATEMRGVQGYVNMASTSTVPLVSGHYSYIQLSPSGGAADGNITLANGLRCAFSNQTSAVTPGVITTGEGIRVLAPTFSATGVATTVRGLAIIAQRNTIGNSSTAAGFTTQGVYIEVGNQGGNTSGSDNNYGLYITSNGGTPGGGGGVTNRAIFSNSTATSNILGAVRIGSTSTIASGTILELDEAVATTGSPTGFLYNGGAHTTLSNAETPDVNFNLARTIQFTGTTTLALQRSFIVQAPTYTSDTATKTITKASTFAITGPPVASTNITQTAAYALDVTTGNVFFGGLLTTYNNIAVGGNGIPSEVKVTRPATQTNTTVTLATYTTPAADGSYEIQANLNVTVSTTVTMTVTCSYTDEANVARVLTLPFFLLAGTLVQSITTAQGNIAYSSMPITIRTKASTSITIATAGTVTAVTYTGEGIIKQLA